MVCRAPDLSEGAVLVSHNPVTVLTTTEAHLKQLKKKPDGHYNKEDLVALVQRGHAVTYDEKAVRAITTAFHIITFGCPPRA